MSQPLVAIITRTKNRPLFLARAIQSVLAQTIHDWVHFIVNDGGDQAPIDALISAHASVYKGRVQVLHNERSLGRPGAANAGFAASTSKLIVFHDDDDTWAPTFLERAVARWRETGAKGVVARAEQVIERTEGERIHFVRSVPFFPSLSALSLVDLALGNCIVNHAFLFEREVLAVIGNLDEQLPVYDDWDFNLRFLHRYDIEVVPEVLAWYHQREVLAAGSARNSFVEDAGRVASARARLINRWLRSPDTQIVGLLIALGPSLTAIDSIRVRVDKLFNFVHAVRDRWSLRRLESLLSNK